MKETDLLLGRFADKHLQFFDSRQLTLYEAILSENDPEILGWIAGREDLPAKHNNDVSKLLLKFKFYE
ncbi:MAG: succinate dehydrogenase assembly factor 2 [Alphaproteobacteria bacterium]|nr:succinate dehydrogenase assembly factor 2 [Alphaproteobacteria bacterium]|tara:strand:+ start:929 stop:1132 length:204 start_codon:yes stop_codon:yes gene_type:complete